VWSPCQATSRSGRERPDRGIEAHAHLMLSVKSARGRTSAPQQGVRRVRHRRGGGRGDLDGPESPSTCKGRASSAACPASINCTVVIFVAPPFGRHARARCVVVTGARRGRHETVTPGRPTIGGRRAASAPTAIRVEPRPSLDRTSPIAAFQGPTSVGSVCRERSEHLMQPEMFPRGRRDALFRCHVVPLIPALLSAARAMAASRRRCPWP